jgi:adenylate cyclase
VLTTPEKNMNVAHNMPSTSPAVDLAREQNFSLGEFRVSPSTREVLTPLRSEIVEPRVMQALVRLVRAQGAVVSRDELVQSCWGGRVVSEDAINRCIAKIRQLAERDGGPWFTIDTIPRVGYRLTGPDTGCGEEKAEEPNKLSICVLPFANMSDDPQQEYFADGITEDIITDLHKVSSLFVVARNTAFTFKGTHVDVTRTAQQLKVAYFLEGSVRKLGARVRITAQLVDGRTGGHLWAERYDRDLNDIFALQDEISHAIVSALQLTLLPEEHNTIGRRGTSSAEAYSLYLMARKTHEVCSGCDARAAEAIIRVCERATEVDPSYAQAWSLMAIGQSKLKNINGTSDGGVAAAHKALALNPRLAEPHAVLARDHFESHRLDEAERELSMALRLAPESYEVNRVAGLLAYRSSKFDEAKHHWEKAFSLMDKDVNAATMLASTCHALGDAEGTRRAAQIALARAETELAHNHIDAAALGFSAYALAALGDAERAKERMDRAVLLEPTNLNRQYNFACALAKYLGETEDALDRLEPVLEKMNEGFLKHTLADPDLAALRAHPRFHAMVSAARSRLEGKAAAE